jgi:hypothetical protein
MTTINDLVLEVEEDLAEKVLADKKKMKDIINDNYVNEHVAWVKSILTGSQLEVELKSTVFTKLLEDEDIKNAIGRFLERFRSITRGGSQKVEDVYRAAFLSLEQYVEATSPITRAQNQLLKKMGTNDLTYNQYAAFFESWQHSRREFGKKLYQAPATTKEPPAKETATTGVSIFTNYDVFWDLLKKDEEGEYKRLDAGKLTEEDFSDPNKTIIGRESPGVSVFPGIESGMVSRKHGQILLVYRGITYKDLDSTNGSLAVDYLDEACNGWGIKHELIPANVQGDEKEAIVGFGMLVTKYTKKDDLPYRLKVIAQKK